jgi:hypothetical protein
MQLLQTDYELLKFLEHCPCARRHAVEGDYIVL